MTNNNKKSTQKLRQVFASIILSASCTIPVVVGNEKTHVDKPKKSTSFWIRTGLEVFLGTGFTWGVVEKIRNSRDINKLNQRIHELSKSLSENELDVISKLKNMIDRFYGEPQENFFLNDDLNIDYHEGILNDFKQTTALSVGNIDSEGFIKTYATAKKINLPEEPSNVTTNPFTKTLYILYLYESEKISNAKFKRLETTYQNLQDELVKQQESISALQQTLYIDTNKFKFNNFKALYNNISCLCNEKPIYEGENEKSQSLVSSMQKVTTKSTTVAQYILQSYKESQKEKSLKKSDKYDLNKISDKTLIKVKPTESDVQITDKLVLNKDKSIKTLRPSNLTELCQVFLSEFYLKSLCDYATEENKPEHLETALNSISAAYLVLNLIQNTDENPKALKTYYKPEFYEDKNYQDLDLEGKLLERSNEILSQWDATIKHLPYFNERVTSVD